MESDYIFLSAFWDLSTTRQFGEFMGPIPWTAINQYAEVHEFDRELKIHFTQIIREMDAGYLDWQSKNKAKADD